MRTLFVSLFALMALCNRAVGADLTVSVRGPHGEPIKDAVATLHFASQPVGPIRFPWPAVMAQKDVQFDPFVLITPVGSDVTFPNKDKVRHHVYSFSPIKTFELKLYGREEARAVHFDKVGVVALGCNIHDQMVGFIDVVDTPFAGKSGDSGDVTLSNAPAGPATLTVWRPYMKAPRNEISRAITLQRQGAAHETVVVDIRPPPGAAMPMPMPMH